MAYGINIKYGRDIDSHAAQKRFLREQKEDEVNSTYENIEYLRISSVYGGGWNGERIKEVLKHLEGIKRWIGKLDE